jgi:REP element-mobilizing transposase RayT
MRFVENEIYHVYNRGNNSQPIFFTDANYNHFLDKIRKELKPICEPMAYCLMPNHFHLLLRATEFSCREIPTYGGKPMQLLARKIGLMLSSYSQQINKQRGTTGSLFQQKTKAKCVSAPVTGQTTLRRGPTVSTPSYIINCMHYIHQNPMKAKLVTKMEEWEHSSFAGYAGFKEDDLCDKAILMEFADYNLTSFYKDSYHIIEDAAIHFEW